MFGLVILTDNQLWNFRYYRFSNTDLAFPKCVWAVIVAFSSKSV